jgi:Tol biopolymer transport system component
MLRLVVMVSLLCLTLVTGARVFGALVPEGAQLAFSAIEADTTITIYLSDLTRSLTVPLVFNVDRTLSVSPTRQLIYSQQVRDETFAIFRLEGGASVQLSPDDARDQYPLWSPNGRQVAFLSSENEVSTLYVMNADGSERRALDTEACPNIVTFPIWLPDSQHIVFRYGDPQLQLTCVVHSESGEIWDFGHETEIVASPVWSPDGGHIAFSVETTNYAHIYVAEFTLNGVTNLRQITTGSDFNTSPRWSPDGTQLAYIMNRGGNREVYVMDSDGGGAHNVSHSGVNDFFPLWSPDGTQIAFISNEGGDWGITLVNVDGTGAHPITYHFGARPIWMVWLP